MGLKGYLKRGEDSRNLESDPHKCIVDTYLCFGIIYYSSKGSGIYNVSDSDDPDRHYCRDPAGILSINFTET